MAQEAPTLDELGTSSDVQKILQSAAQDVVKEPTERWAAKSNMVRMGKQALPERVRVFRRLNGRPADLPTVTIGASLAKRALDGGPVFVRTQGECVAQPDFIDQLCDVCIQVQGRSKRFYSMANYRGHMRGLHTLEWEEMRESAAEERQNRQTAALLALAEKGLTNGNTEGSEDGAEFVCHCGREAKSQAGLLAHQRSHQEVS